ncbi:MAG: Gfo/Idh/MocA family oxidoreductase [Betaproteobacteria bacterium]|nr:Gfo/Idh/MocA family oxidoreductase [Betaproteobacteria bacterium]MDH3436166.1 Gfo/Idh/MocA family oxidoreductase [Betaproteobacteria bacterium]
MSIRIAAIEVGHWHSLFDAAYLKALVKMPDVQLAGIQDPDPALVAQRAAQLGGPPVFTDYREMLAKTSPDFVVALGRHNAMAGIAHFLLDEGYPFLMEKPMGLDAREVRGIADRAAAKKAFAAVPLFQRYHPFVAHARRMIADGAFGAVSHFHFRSNRGSSARYVSWGSPWMLDPAVAGGGCLRNIGLHGIDLFLYLTGEDADVAGAQLSSRALGKGVEDYAAVLLHTPGGVLGTIEVGNTFPGQGADGEWKLAGRDALLVQQGGSVRCTTVKGEQEVAEPPGEPLPVVAVRDILAHWQSGQPPATGPEDCYRAMRVVDKAYSVARPESR